MTGAKLEHEALVTSIAAGLEHDLAVRGLFVGGSHGRGTADQWSDLDLVAVVASADQPAMVTSWRRLLEAIAPIVFWNQIDGDGVVLNAITSEWQRVDLSIQSVVSFARRARDQVKPLLDRDGLYAALPATRPDRRPDAGKIHYQINEFIRVLGLTPVVLGRCEYVSAVWGTGLLRNLLIDLLQQQYCRLPDPGGALHLSKLLPPEQMAILAALPYPGPHRDDLIAAQAALAQAFFPAARRLADQLQLDWPADFEAATRRHLAATLGPDAIVW